MLLSELRTKESGVIKKINGNGPFRKRIIEMGFVKGQSVKVIKNAPLQDPVEYSIMNYAISLRRSEAALIEVEPLNGKSIAPRYFGTTDFQMPLHVKEHLEKTITIAFVGNPNCGKTSIFNNASRSYEHVGNYSGVTIETKLAKVEYGGYVFNIFDLPGTYSLSSDTPEEIYVRNFLANNTPDVVVNVLDATNLERNLYLTTQLIDMNIRMVIALNMFDEFRKKGDHFNHLSFGALLGVPVVPTVGSKGKGFARLFEAVIAKYNEKEKDRKKIHINYGKDLEDSVKIIEEILSKGDYANYTNESNPRYLALRLLEEDEHIDTRLSATSNFEGIKEVSKKEQKRLRLLFDDEPDTLIADARFGFIAGALRETYQTKNIDRLQYSHKIDKVLTHKYLGIPIFFAFLWLMFTATFTLGQYPVQWIEGGISWLSLITSRIVPQGDFQSLLIDGIIGGVGGVIVFLPNILILFFFISFLEDTGYMARAAFIMDKAMHKIGLHGKSFIPLVMGFGCNVPAIMSTRIIESKSNRMLTMLIMPFMSCSARLPIYILIIGTFFPHYQGTVLFGIYLTGIFLAVISAIIFRKLFFRWENSPFVMELPPYRMATLRNTTRHMWHKGVQYLKKIGGIILVASVIIWGLDYYPKNLQSAKNQANDISIVQGSTLENSSSNSSYLKRIGKSIEPIMKPLGFDWKLTVSILSGVAGKELVVSTMGVLYNNEKGKGDSLGGRIKNDKYEQGPMKGMSVVTPIVALSFLMFTLVYFPCMAVIATIAKEGNSILWAFFMIFYTTGLAWIMSWGVYNIGSLFVN